MVKTSGISKIQKTHRDVNFWVEKKDMSGERKACGNPVLGLVAKR